MSQQILDEIEGRQFRTDVPDWQTVLDVDAFAEAEGQDWVFHGATVLPRSNDRAILRLSRGGGDAVALREFDLLTCAFVADGFSLQDAKSDVAWIDRDTLLLSSAWGDGMATASGYARTVRVWRRGEDPAAASVAAYRLPPARALLSPTLCPAHALARMSAGV